MSKRKEQYLKLWKLVEDLLLKILENQKYLKKLLNFLFGVLFNTDFLNKGLTEVNWLTNPTIEIIGLVNRSEAKKREIKPPTKICPLTTK